MLSPNLLSFVLLSPPTHDCRPAAAPGAAAGGGKRKLLGKPNVSYMASLAGGGAGGGPGGGGDVLPSSMLFDSLRVPKLSGGRP